MASHGLGVHYYRSILLTECEKQQAMAEKVRVKNEDREILLNSKNWDCDLCKRMPNSRRLRNPGVFILHERPGRFSVETRSYNRSGRLFETDYFSGLPQCFRDHVANMQMFCLRCVGRWLNSPIRNIAISCLRPAERHKRPKITCKALRLAA